MRFQSWLLLALNLGFFFLHPSFAAAAAPKLPEAFDVPAIDA